MLTNNLTTSIQWAIILLPMEWLKRDLVTCDTLPDTHISGDLLTALRIVWRGNLFTSEAALSKG